VKSLRYLRSGTQAESMALRSKWVTPNYRWNGRAASVVPCSKTVLARRSPRRWCPDMATANDAKVIGYFAQSSPSEVVCDGDACVIAGSDSDLRAYISKLGPGEEINHTLKKTRFGEIMRGMRLGAAYAFDEIAYNRFYPLAKREGLELGPEDFLPTATGRHFVRVQIINGT